jgi:hypothetical protein
MKLSELRAVVKRLKRARDVLAVLDRASGIEIDLLKADGTYVHYKEVVQVLDDAAFIETVKAYLRDSQTKILNEALAQLAAHGIELDDPEEDEDEEEQEEAA